MERTFDPSRDILAAILRRPLFFATVMLLCLVLGVLYFVKTAPTYQSTAELLVQSRQSPAFSSETIQDRADSGEITTEGHTQILLSPELVKRTINKIGRKNLPSFQGHALPVDFALENLSVDEKELGSGVLIVKFRSKDPDECHKFVAVLVDQYFAFLDEATKSISDETTNLIEKARNELGPELRRKREEYALFRQTAPLLWGEDGQGMNPHQLQLVQLERARADLDIERLLLVGKLGQVNSSIEGGDLTAIYFEAIAKLNAGGLRDDQFLSSRERIRTLTSELTDQKIEETRLSEAYGDNHPDLITLRANIATIESDIKKAQLSMLPFRNEPVVENDGEQNGEEDGEQNGEEYGQVDPAVKFVNMYAQSLQQNIDSIDQQIQEMNNVVDLEQKKFNNLQTFIAKDVGMRSDLDRTQKLFDSVLARLDEINLVSGYGGYRTRMLAIPKLGKRVAPGLIKTMAIAGFLGTLMGMAFCFLVDMAQVSFRNTDEIREMMEAPIIGRIPKMPRRALSGKAKKYSKLANILVSAHKQGSTFAEAYRAVRTSMLFSAKDKDARVIQITSPLPGDGKSTLSSNLAFMIANSGKRVILIDADFRRPTIHKLFGMNKDVPSNLALVVTGEEEFDERELQTAAENLFVMPCGARIENPSEILSSPEFSDLLSQLRESFDFVIVDTPPLLAVTDPCAVAAIVDGTILALRIQRGVKQAAHTAKELLGSVDGKLLGVVVNNVDPNSAFAKSSHKYSYGYGYGYGYTQESVSDNDSSKKRKKAKRRIVAKETQSGNDNETSQSQEPSDLGPDTRTNGVPKSGELQTENSTLPSESAAS